MKGSLNPKIKICCIANKLEADLAMKYGATAIGLVSHMPSGPGVISEKSIKEIAAHVPPSIDTFFLTSETRANAIISQHQLVLTNTIQLVDKVEQEDFKLLRKALPEVTLIQVIHVQDENSIEEAKAAASYADALLLDSGRPQLKTKILGGTGQVHDWKYSKRIRSVVNIPIYLAGGLHNSNVLTAIKTVQPYGIDLCTGVRTDGKLNEDKLRAFFKAINSVQAL